MSEPQVELRTILVRIVLFNVLCLEYPTTYFFVCQREQGFRFSVENQHSEIIEQPRIDARPARVMKVLERAAGRWKKRQLQYFYIGINLNHVTKAVGVLIVRTLIEANFFCDKGCEVVQGLEGSGARWAAASRNRSKRLQVDHDAFFGWVIFKIIFNLQRLFIYKNNVDLFQLRILQNFRNRDSLRRSAFFCKHRNG